MEERRLLRGENSVNLGGAEGKPLPSDQALLVIDIDSPGHPFDAGWSSADSQIAAPYQFPSKLPGDRATGCPRLIGLISGVNIHYAANGCLSRFLIVGPHVQRLRLCTPTSVGITS